MRSTTKLKWLCSILILTIMLAGCNNMKPPVLAGTETVPTIAQDTTAKQATAAPTEPDETAVPATVPTETTIATESGAEPVETQLSATEPPTTTPLATAPTEIVPPTTTPPATKAPTEPPETESTTAATPPTEPTEPTKETIDIASIETSANAYAASLGYIIDTSLQKGNCGYYPPDYRPLMKTEEGIKAAKEMVDATTAQLNSRFTTEHSNILVEEAYGYARASCRVEHSHTDELGDWYFIYIYYG